VTFTLGRTPDKFELVLSNDADFVSALRRPDTAGPWPLTLEATIEIATETPTEWTATVDEQYLRWEVDEAEVATVIAARPKKAKLWYVDGTTRLLWATGTVKIA